MQLLVRKHDGYSRKYNNGVTIASLIGAMIMTISIMFNLLPVAADRVSGIFGTSAAAMFIGRLLMSLPPKNTSIVGCCVVFCLFQIITHFIDRLKATVNKHIDIPLLLLSLLFGFSMTFGNMLEASKMRLSEMSDGISQAIKIVASSIK